VGVSLEVEFPGSVRGALDFTDRTSALYVIIEVLGEVETMMDFGRLHALSNWRLGKSSYIVVSQRWCWARYPLRVYILGSRAVMRIYGGKNITDAI
jgi:hypothetical protein